MLDFVVVDTPPGFTPEVIASIDSSSGVCMVGDARLALAEEHQLGLETLALMGYVDDRVRLVLNRADSRVGITQTTWCRSSVAGPTYSCRAIATSPAS